MKDKIKYEIKRRIKMNGFKELMKDLGVNNFEELIEYINSEEHKNEQIVIELKSFIEFFIEKEVKENEK